MTHTFAIVEIQEIYDRRQRGFQVFFKVFHCHCREIVQLFGDDVMTANMRCHSYHFQCIVNFI